MNYKSTSNLANEVPVRFSVRWIRNFIIRNEIPYTKIGGWIYLNEEQEMKFWNRINLYLSYPPGTSRSYWKRLSKGLIR